ncbi:MAG: 4'-phosphopantetheinyl transferase superfamily protein [Planctomycetota bacterium]
MNAFEPRFPTWAPVAGVPSALPGVDVFRFSLAASVEPSVALRCHLDAEECARADRFVVPTAAEQFVLGRVGLRRILGHFLQVAPRAVRLRYGVHGRPELAAPFDRAGLTFNLAHSHGMAICAVTHGGGLGVDLERVRAEVATEAIARRYFATAEVAALLSVPERERARAFFRIWTRKEAYLKAVGTGIAGVLQSFEVNLEPGPAARFVAHYREPSETSRWMLFDIADLEEYPEYAASLVVEVGAASSIRRWDGVPGP